MKEIIGFLTIIFGDGMTAVGVFLLTVYIFYFSIVRTLRIYCEGRSPDGEDVKKMLKNVRVIAVMMIGLSIAISIVNKVNLPEEHYIRYKIGIVFFFLLPLVSKASYGKDFA
jgi:hypothetical protein